MTKPNYTPGPWLSSGREVFVDTRYQVCCGRGSVHGCCGEPDVAGDYFVVATTDEANAHLIAAAPDMYEAALPFEELIQLLLDDCDNEKPFICTHEPTGKTVTIKPEQGRAFLAAMAKARGESPQSTDGEAGE